MGKNINRQLDRLRQAGNMTTQQDRYFNLETQLRHCDDKTAECQNHSDLVTTRLERDIERFRVEWHERMRQVLEVFHKQQAEFFENQVKDFSSVLPALGTLDSKRSDLATKAPQSEKLEINYSVNSGGVKASVAGKNSASAAEKAPPPAAAPSSPPPAEDLLGSGVQEISLDASYSSEDGFGTES